MHVKSGIRSHSKYEFIKHKTCTHTPSLRSLFFLFLFPLPLAFYLNLGENSILRIISHDRQRERSCHHPWRIHGEGMEKSRCGSRAVGPVDAGLEEKKGRDPVKTRLTRSSSSYRDEGLHLLTRTTAPLLITQSSGRRLRGAERPAPTPSPPTSTLTSTSSTTTLTPTPLSSSWGRGSYDTSMLST